MHKVLLRKLRCCALQTNQNCISLLVYLILPVPMKKIECLADSWKANGQKSNPPQDKTWIALETSSL